MITQNKIRCAWVNNDPIYINYHDREWGVPIYDDRLLFEFLILEGAQAGLNWITILKKRDNYRKCFDKFNAKKIAKYDQNKFEQLMANSGIIRNKLKIKAAIINAQAFLQVKQECGSFSEHIWHFVNGKPISNHWKNNKFLPTSSDISSALSKDLKKRGFKFVGPTICYAFMQAVGMVNDHTMDCFRYKELKKSRR
ncbi:MAG: DNA-3-methyladenine glycosylase I [Rickettsiaceae bacterium]|nr:DNA-3-methyladenine glycosylase I [Rickettsiaceae bacterium]